MANYTVGNLQIAFETVDKTASDFSKLKDSLSEIQQAIGFFTKDTTQGISLLGTRFKRLNSIIQDIDIEEFSNKFSKIRDVMRPLLSDIRKASQGISAFNQIVQKIGVRNIYRVADEIERIKKSSEEAGSATEVFAESIQKNSGGLIDSENNIRDISFAYDEAKQTVSALTNELLNLYYSTSEIDTDSVDKIVRLREEIEKADKAVRRALMSEEELLLDDYKLAIAEKKKEISILEAKIAMGKAGEMASQYADRIRELKQQLDELKNPTKPFDAIAEVVMATPFNDAKNTVSELTNELLNLYYSTGNIDRTSIQSIVDLTSRINEAQNEVRRALMSEEELILEDYRLAIAEKEKEIAILQASIAMGKAGDKADEYKQRIIELREELKRLKAAQDDNTDSSSSGAGAFSKLLKSIGRITFYRAVRRALQLITQSIVQSIQEFAKLDDSVNETMSSITSSLKAIQFSFGTIFIPLLQAVEPILSSIADGFANFANTISQALATGDTYWAINSDAIKDYREQLENTTGTLASFDKINSLTQKDDNSIFFEERQVDKENAKVKETRDIIESIKSIILDIGTLIGNVWKDISPILGIIITEISKILPRIAKIISLIVQILSPVLERLANDLTILFDGVISDILDTIGYALQFIIDLINGDFSSAFTSLFNFSIGIINAVISAVETVVNSVIRAINSFNFLNTVSKWFNSLLGWNLPQTGLIPEQHWNRLSYADFADGGFPTKGTLFRAGEAGAEFVYNAPNGQSGVANVAQLKSAFLEALVEYGRGSGGRGDNCAININIDGQKVFEATRRVANRKGLDFSRV